MARNILCTSLFKYNTSKQLHNMKKIYKQQQSVTVDKW